MRQYKYNRALPTVLMTVLAIITTTLNYCAEVNPVNKAEDPLYVRFSEPIIHYVGTTLDDLTPTERAIVRNLFYVIYNDTDKPFRIFTYILDPDIPIHFSDSEQKEISDAAACVPCSNIPLYSLKKDDIFPDIALWPYTAATIAQYLIQNMPDKDYAKKLLENALQKVEPTEIKPLLPGEYAIIPHISQSVPLVGGYAILRADAPEAHIFDTLGTHLLVYFQSAKKWGITFAPFKKAQACPTCKKIGRLNSQDLDRQVNDIVSIVSSKQSDLWCQCSCQKCGNPQVGCGCCLIFLSYDPLYVNSSHLKKQADGAYIDEQDLGKWIPEYREQTENGWQKIPEPLEVFSHTPDAAQASTHMFDFDCRFQEPKAYYLGSDISQLTVQERIFIWLYYDIIHNTSDKNIRIFESVITDQGKARIQQMIDNKEQFEQNIEQFAWALQLKLFETEPALFIKQEAQPLEPGHYMLVPRVYPDGHMIADVARYELIPEATPEHVATYNPLEFALYAYNTHEQYGVVLFYSCQQCNQGTGPMWFRHEGELRDFYKSYALNGAKKDWCQCICSKCDQKKLLCPCRMHVLQYDPTAKYAWSSEAPSDKLTGIFVSIDK